ncbi:MAG: hypothetical protein CVV64_11455 [Candidatus Wallbacteria bacterium HGW-Wallbacteria-1]|jgi:hypothetical protein|uniref:Uncharacterized protein n=1 Tax=Candidatus Wallbacteria bacterium HGW-Wallbacteria-1 TaxID=2013854 RepID=A0A2N1PNL6_9BACT|nr:MAG: hypothetical protein CVV64_11455 [Candidatus Wallbacteria bacterium HGW-Wallbacteria-1]
MKLSDFILCDDIRREIGGKHSLMGVYGDTINIVLSKNANQKSNIIPLSLFCRFTGCTNTFVPALFKLNYIIDEKNSEDAITGQLALEQVTNIFSIYIVNYPFKLVKNCHLKFEITIQNGKNEEIVFSPDYSIKVNVKSE